MNNTKPTLRERIAALKAEKATKVSSRSTKEAKTRVAASWTIAKTLLPSAPNEVQFKLASSLLGNSTQALTAMLRQTAVNAHYTKIAEKFEQVHKVELNELIEQPAFLEKMKSEVEKELKGEAKNAKRKKADEEKPLPEAEAAPLEEGMEDMAEGMEEGAEDIEEGAEEGMEDMDAAPDEEFAPEGDGSPEDAKKEAIQEQIDTLKDDVAALEAEISEGEELDFEEIFNDENMEDKTNNLANEGDEFEEEEGEEADFFAPSSAEDMENSMDDDLQVTSSNDFFSHSTATASMDSLFADSKSAGKDTVYDQGDLSDSLMGGDVADHESDHEDDLFFEVLGDIKEVAFNEGGYKRDSEPKFEEPKTSGKVAKVATAQKQKQQAQVLENKKRPIRSLGNVKSASPGRSKEQAMLSSLVFPDDESFQ